MSVIISTSVDIEMCCPNGKCGCQYFILLTLKNKNSWVLDFFNKKLILDYYFYFNVLSCVFISNFQHSPPPPPKGYKTVSLD